MAKAKFGHFFLLLLYATLAGWLVVSLGLLIWTTWLTRLVYPFVPPLVSPLPPNQTDVQVSSAVGLASNLWLPKEKVGAERNLKKPDLQAEVYLAVDQNTGQILLAKNHHSRKPVASLVKVMTALVALEHARPDDQIRVSDQATTVGEDTMGLVAGEKLTLTDLLYGLIMHSGNDAAEAIAEGVAGRRQLFINWMNRKAYELGLSNTHFVNPSGLMEKDHQDRDYHAEEYSTAYDLVVIAHAYLEQPLLKKIAAAADHIIWETEDHRTYYLYSQTNLLTTDPRVKGLKMGYTPAAGLSGITYAEQDGQEIIGVVLNTPNRRDDLRTLIDYAFEAASH